MELVMRPEKIKMYYIVNTVVLTSEHYIPFPYKKGEPCVVADVLLGASFSTAQVYVDFSS